MKDEIWETLLENKLDSHENEFQQQMIIKITLDLKHQK